MKSVNSDPIASETPHISIEWIPEHRRFELVTEVMLPRTRSEVFGFFSDAFQLQRITPEWLNFRILTVPPIQLEAGCLIDYRIGLHGIPLRWRTEISSWNPPFSFTDRQLRGPYLLWEHLHTFETIGENTLMRDCVHYRVLGGRLINRLFIGNYLRAIFAHRAQRMLELFAPLIDSDEVNRTEQAE